MWLRWQNVVQHDWQAERDDAARLQKKLTKAAREVWLNSPLGGLCGKDTTLDDLDGPTTTRHRLSALSLT